LHPDACSNLTIRKGQANQITAIKPQTHASNELFISLPNHYERPTLATVENGTAVIVIKEEI
jgi:hypothetical protein